MKKLTAIFRLEKGGNLKYNTTDYFKTKKAFENDLKSYGYIVLAVLTDKQIVDIKQKFGMNEVEDFVQAEIPTPTGVDLLEPKRVSIGSYYKMQDGKIVYAGFHGQLILTTIDGSDESVVYDLNQFNKALTHGEIEEVTEVVETLLYEREAIDNVGNKLVKVKAVKIVIDGDKRTTTALTTDGEWIAETDLRYIYY